MYCRGRVIGKFSVLYRELRRGNYVYVRGKLYHPKVLANWSVAMLSLSIATGHVITAVKNPNYIPKVPF